MCVYNDQLKDGLEEELFYHYRNDHKGCLKGLLLVLGPLSFTLSAHVQG